MKHITRLKLYLTIDAGKRIPLRTIEAGTDMVYIVDLPLIDLSAHHEATIRIETNAEEI